MADRTPLMGAAVLYASILNGVRRVARQHGYAIGVHGSMTCDLDLIAAPWIEAAADAAVLAEAVRVEIDGEFRGGPPSDKPHGRRGWSIHVGAYYVDLSVMPRLHRLDGMG